MMEIETAAYPENYWRSPTSSSYRLLTPTERKWVNQLMKVKFKCGDRAKEFIADLANKTMATDKQCAYLRKIVYRYRRQIA